MGKRLIKAHKVYFYDTGLLCFMLGIYSTQELAVHPMRGAIFENLVVCEFLKRQHHLGLNSSLYFYRDNKKEVDLLREEGMCIDAFEIKVAKSDNTAFYDGLKYLEKLYGERVASSSVIYAGVDERDRRSNALKNYQHL